MSRRDSARAARQTSARERHARLRSSKAAAIPGEILEEGRGGLRARRRQRSGTRREQLGEHEQVQQDAGEREGLPE